MEHHLSNYSISPAPLQTLAYLAGKLREAYLGTQVIILPWNDRVHVRCRFRAAVANYGMAEEDFGTIKGNEFYRKMKIDPAKRVPARMNR